MAKDQELLQAVKAKDLSSARKLLAKIKAAIGKKGGKKYNVNIQDGDGFTTLHHAALAGIADVAMSLIDMDCNINATDNKGMCPLHLAAWAGKVEVARLLLEAKAEVNLCSDNGVTALHLACQHGNADVAEVLLDNNCDPTVINHNGEASLDLACRFGHTQVVELLLKSSSVRKLLSVYANNPKNTRPPLHLACKTGHVEIVRMLLEAGADINEVDESGSCLHEASLYGKTEVVKLLLDWGIDATAKNKDQHTAEDIVHRFTSSNASKEIKELLREVTEVKGTYAKAIKDHMNIYDPTCLIFRTGSTIEILEQNENGRWKGRIHGEEKVGYFPANFVKLASPKKRSSTRVSAREAAVLPMGSFELVALAPVPPSPGFHRNSPRLSSFGKSYHKSSSSCDEDTERQPNASEAPQPPTRATPVNNNGIKQKGSVKKPGQSLQYIEVAVEQNSPPALTSGASCAVVSSKTQYAEVVLPKGDGPRCLLGSPNGEVEEVDPFDELPTLPGKEHQQATTDDIWVRNAVMPALPPKTRVRTEIPGGVKPTIERSPPQVPATRPEIISTPELLRREAVKPATPELSRKAYEVMSSPIKETASPQVSRKAGPAEGTYDQRRPEKTTNYFQYENVQLKERAPQHPQSMIIFDVDRHSDSEEPEGYVVINQRSNTVSAGGYENVCPSRQRVPIKKHSYENVPVPDLLQSERYESMSSSKQLSYVEMKNTQTAEEKQNRQSERVEDQQGDESEGREYVTMKRGSDGSSHDYINIKSDGMPSENPTAPQGTVTLTMRDYNVLYDWLERIKLSVYIDNFVKGGFDIISVRGITPEDLSAIDIVKTGHRKKVLSESTSLEPTNVFPKEKPPTIMIWLKLIGMEQYIPQFLDGGFDDMDFVQDVTVEDLDTIGVNKPGHRRKLWMAVNALSKHTGTEEPVDKKQNEVLKSETPVETLREKAHNTTEENNGEEGQMCEGKNGCESSDDAQHFYDDTAEVSADAATAKTHSVSYESSLQNAPTSIPAKPSPELDCYAGSSDDLYSNASSSSSNISVIEVTKPMSTFNRLSEVQDVDEIIEVPALSAEKMEDLNEAAPSEVNNVSAAEKKEMPDSELREVSPQSFTEERSSAGVESKMEEDQAVKCEPTQMKIDTTESATNNNNVYEDSTRAATQRGTDIELNKPQSREAVINTSQSSVRGTRTKPAPPPVKPKSFKKRPPRVPPKPRTGSSRGASFTGQPSDSAPEAETGSTGGSLRHRRTRSTGSDPGGFFFAPLPSHQNGTDWRGRSGSTSSRSSVESIIEEFEDRRKSLERIRPLRRKYSAPEMLPSRWSGETGESMSHGGGEDLEVQIKNVLRRKSTEELPSFHSEGPRHDFGSEGTGINNDFNSGGQELAKEEEKEKDLGDDLMNDINNLLSDISTELDSMY